MKFIPHTAEDIQYALKTIGVESLDALFKDIPKTLRQPEMDIPTGMDEVSLMDHLRGLANKNKPEGPNFLGGGLRRHFIPSVTPHLAMQSEFVTAYTPYQAEVAQGMLQATFEYQTMMAELTGLSISNASMYDGASAMAEAALLALRHTGRNKVVISQGVHPEFREVMTTYLKPLGTVIEEIALEQLITPSPALSNEAACLIVQNPNHLGYLESMPAFAEAAHAVGALFIAVVDPLSLAVLTAPGHYSADVALGDGQTLGNPVNLGGPSFGFMVINEPLLRQFPGRLVGQTKDVDGKRAFVLTLQAREQHIRRSKAKSNICTNHQLAAVMAAVNMSALGPQGLKEMATQSVVNAHKLAGKLEAAGFDVLSEPRFFNEFVMRSPLPAAELRHKLAQAGVQAGVPVPDAYGLGDAVLLATTELVSERDMDTLVSALRTITEHARPLEVAHD